MKLKSILLTCFIAAQAVQADTVQVPRLPDGSVDIEQLLTNFVFVFPLHSSGEQASDFSGSFLGEEFNGNVTDTDTMHEFNISVNAPTLSEHANFLIAVLATSAICARNELGSGPVLWEETKNRNGGNWEVSSSCSP